MVIAWKTAEEAEFAREIHELIPLQDVNGQNVDSIIAELGSLSWNNFVRLLRARQVCVHPPMLSATLEDRVDEMFLEGISSSHSEKSSSQSTFTLPFPRTEDELASINRLRPG